MYKVIYLYILKCNDNTYYTGATNNLERRIIEHHSGINPESYTFSQKPILLVWYEIFNDFNLAFEWETKMKKWSKKKKKLEFQAN